MRFLFKGTFVQRLRITPYLYQKLINLKVRKFESTDDTVTVPFRDYYFKIEKNDITILPTLIDQTYEKNEIDHLLDIVDENSTFIDIGANVGIYSVILSEKMIGNGTLISIEPNPKTIKILKANLDQIKSNRKIIIESAISDTAGISKFSAPNFQGTGKIVDRSVVQPSHLFEVTTLTLDNIIENYYVKKGKLIIKCDVEGYEPKVIMGGIKLISLYKPFLLIEISGQNSRDAQIDWTETVSFLSKIYSKFIVFNKNKFSLIQGNELLIRETLESLFSDGKLYNVLFY